MLLIMTFKGIQSATIVTLVATYLIALGFGRVWGTETLFSFPNDIISRPDFSLLLSVDFSNSLSLAFLPTILTMLFLSIFDSTGAIVGLAQVNNFFDEKGKPLRFKKSLQAEAGAVVASSLFGTPPTAIYVESAVGMSLGGKTGIVAIMVGVLFLPLLFLSSLIASIPIFVVCPALFLVGTYMVRSLAKIDWTNNIDVASALVTILLMALTGSIAYAIIWGVLLYVVATFLSDKNKLTKEQIILAIFCFSVLVMQSM